MRPGCRRATPSSRLAFSGSSWRWYDLTAQTGAPQPAGDPFGYAFDQQGTQHVVYRDDQQGIQELWWDASGWHPGSLTAATDGPTPTSDPVGYTFVSQGTQHVTYVGTDGHIHELSWGVAGWGHDDLTALTGAIGPSGYGAPAAYPFDPAPGVPVPTRHVLYAGLDGHLHELWWDSSGWHLEDLTVQVGLPPIDEHPAGFADATTGTQLVFVVDTDHHLHVLTWTP